MGSYVDISGIPLNFLEFMGYIVREDNSEFTLLEHKGDPHIIWKQGPQFLFVEDDNDVPYLKGRRRVASPPQG